jgi:hypothetical protein
MANKTHWLVRAFESIKESEYFSTRGKLKIKKRWQV